MEMSALGHPVSTAVEVVQVVAWIAIICGLSLFAFRLRNVPSASLVLSAIAIAAWVFFSDVQLEAEAPAVLATATSEGGAPVANAATSLTRLGALGYRHAVITVCESLLVLWFSLSFLLTAWSARSRKRFDT